MMWGISDVICPSFAAEARYLSPLSRNARVKRLKLAPLSEQALLLGSQMPLLTIGQAGQRARGLVNHLWAELEPWNA